VTKLPSKVWDNPEGDDRNPAELLRNFGAVADLLTKTPRVLSFLPFPCESVRGSKAQRAAFFVVG